MSEASRTPLRPSPGSGGSTGRLYVVFGMRRLEADVFPVLGERPVNEIQAPDVITMVKVIAERGAFDVAKRSLQNCGQFFRNAIAHG